MIDIRIKDVFAIVGIIILLVILLFVLVSTDPLHSGGDEIGEGISNLCSNI